VGNRDNRPRRPGISAWLGEKGAKGKSRGVSTESVLGTIEDREERNRAWFNYLDQRTEDAFRTGAEVIEMPHKKFLTFRAATVSPALWKRAGSRIETTREIRVNDAGCKRKECQSKKRERFLVHTTVAKIGYPGELSRPHDADWINPPDEDILEWREAKEQENILFGTA
jgi:hypothetical protein